MAIAISNATPDSCDLDEPRGPRHKNDATNGRTSRFSLIFGRQGLVDTSDFVQYFTILFGPNYRRRGGSQSEHLVVYCCRLARDLHDAGRGYVPKWLTF